MRPSTRLALAVAAIACLAATFAQAQPSARTHRIAILGNEDTPPWQGLRDGLRELGYIDGRNVAMDWRWSQGKPDSLSRLAQEAAALRPDVIVASGTQAVRAAMQATSSVPIVMAVSSYPEKIGLVQSLARPGGNVTGLTNIAAELHAKKLEILRELAPRVSSIAVIWNPDSPVEIHSLGELERAAGALGMTVRRVGVRRPDDFPAALAALAAAPADALIAHGNPVNFRGRQQIAEFTLKHKMPSVFEERLFAEAGGLVSYAPSFTDLFRRAATYVDKVLKGASPSELPVEQPTKFELVINASTARALGLAIPPALHLRADAVIE